MQRLFRLGAQQHLSLIPWGAVRALLTSEYITAILSNLTNLGGAQEKGGVTSSDRGNKLAQKPQHEQWTARGAKVPPNACLLHLPPCSVWPRKAL